MTKLLIDLSTVTLYNSHKCAYSTFKEEYPNDITFRKIHFHSAQTRAEES